MLIDSESDIVTTTANIVTTTANGASEQLHPHNKIKKTADQLVCTSQILTNNADGMAVATQISAETADGTTVATQAVTTTAETSADAAAVVSPSSLLATGSNSVGVDEARESTLPDKKGCAQSNGFRLRLRLHRFPPPSKSSPTSLPGSVENQIDWDVLMQRKLLQLQLQLEATQVHQPVEKKP